MGAGVYVCATAIIVCPPHKPIISRYLDMRLIPLATYGNAIIKKSTRTKGFSTYKIFGTRELRLNKCKSGSYDYCGGADIDPRTHTASPPHKSCVLCGRTQFAPTLKKFFCG